MTTVYLAPGPFGAGGQFFGLGGLPLNLGTITTYAAGGTTPLATYTTSIGNVQNANPIVLGTDGRPPNEIWVTSDSYRFDLKDALGNLIKTYDNLGGSIDAASLAASTGSSLVGWIYAFTGAVAATVQNWISWQSVNVFGFMTVAQIADVQAGTLSLDVTTPIKNAINAACTTTNPKSVRFPAGNYKVTATNVLGPNVNTTGLRIYGDGPQASLITLANTGATDLWFYDNGPSSVVNPSLIAPTFEDIGFIGTVTSSGVVSGFRLYGTAGYPSQKFKFVNIYGQGLTRVLDCEGTTNASENSFEFSRFSACGTLIYCNNGQAFNNRCLHTDFESYFGNVFDYQTSGVLNVLGGSFVTSSANTTYILNFVSPAGGMTGQVNVNGIRCELSSATSKICNITGNNNAAKYLISGSDFAAAAGGTRTSIIVGGKGSQFVQFKGCDIASAHTVSWVEGTSNFYFNATAYAVLEFDHSTGITVASIAYTDTFSLGYTRILNSPSGVRDWEGGRLGYIQGGLPQNATLKVASGWVYYWPDVTNNPTGIPSGAIGSQVIIPIGSTIKSIFVRKAQFGAGGGAAYQLEVRDGAGAPALITVPAWATGTNQSTAALQDDVHQIFITNLLKQVTDLASGTITVRSVAGANAGAATARTMKLGDFFFVEYI